MTTSSRFYWLAASIATFVVVDAVSSISVLRAQAEHGALESLSKNRSEILQIEAQTSKVSDQDMAVDFAGDVRVTLGDTGIRCESLIAYYEHDVHPGNVSAIGPGPGGARRVRKLAARDVVVTYRNQTARSDFGIFEWDTNLASLNGTVTVTQGSNVLRGDYLITDLVTGASRMQAKSAPRPQ